MKKAADVEVCAHCGGRNPTNRCSRCGLVKYCCVSCQRAHWKGGGHKQACLAPEQRTLEAAQAAAPPRAPLAAKGDECAICLDPLNLATAASLPCGHVFHPVCVEGLRSFGVKQVCPMCRTELPPGPQKLFEDGAQLFFFMNQRVERKDVSRRALTAKEKTQYEEVLQLWTQAANQGQATAQYNLALMYFKGEGVAQSDVQAMRWYRNAADQGYSNAQCSIGTMYAGGRGVAQNNAEAVRWFQKAADQGQVGAQCNLGTMYYEGRGVVQSDAQAVRWYRKAADQDHGDAQSNLGAMYDEGRGVAQNDVEAVRWFQKAADQGKNEAQFNLSNHFFLGQGVPKDLAESHKYLTLAAEGGIEEAKHNLKACFPNGSSTNAQHSAASACSHCGVASLNLKACSRCKLVFYCGKECQTAHWKAGHKAVCPDPKMQS